MKVYLILECGYGEGCSIFDIYLNKETRDKEFEILENSGTYNEDYNVMSEDWVLNEL
jgi:hypothetical protein